MDRADTRGRLSHLVETCRKAGMRVTPQRLRIFEELLKAGNHPTAEELHHRLRRTMPTLSLDTVYRTLTLLAHTGVVIRLNTVHAAARFDGAVDPHDHLICRMCGAINDIDWKEARQLPLPLLASEWGKAELIHVDMIGLCRDCLQKNRKVEDTLPNHDELPVNNHSETMAEGLC